MPDDLTRALRFDRAAETWAAISLSLLLFAIAGLIFFIPHYIWAGLASVLILLLHFWKWIILAALLVMGISLMVQRLRELTG